MRALGLAALLLLAPLLAGCTSQESCGPAPVVAVLPLGPANVDVQVLREVMRERGWTLPGPDDTFGTFPLGDGTTVTATLLPEDDLDHPGVRFEAPSNEDDADAPGRTLAPAVEPVVAGLEERTSGDLTAWYARGPSTC